MHQYDDRRLAHQELSFIKPTWLSAPLRPLATMRAYITVEQWFALIQFVLAVCAATSSGTKISTSRPTGSVSSTSSSNYGGSSSTSATVTSAVTSSLPGNVSRTSVASGPSTQAQLNIPISPASFSPFPVPSDNPIPPNYPVVDPTDPPYVSYTRLSFWLLALTLWTIFHRWAPLNFPTSDLRGQPHTLRQGQRWGLPSLVLPLVMSYDGRCLTCFWLTLNQCWIKRVNLNHWSFWLIESSIRLCRYTLKCLDAPCVWLANYTSSDCWFDIGWKSEHDHWGRMDERTMRCT